ncbi:hypothetical protein TrLO_g1740 [Triparma laevis f. longispina]|uniref:Uncharacterized protein n=1 Tax=Triparma laevis f. longispina TaxID=1714387 RepID=A0A9W7F104_9STRA|nr:hypothetical protein TrLO_g1740 [Triparma laevis f. longispina]
MKSSQSSSDPAAAARPCAFPTARELARNDGFNEYFQKQFNGNEATYLGWKEVLTITRLEDLVKLKALAKLCSEKFFNDVSLLAVA